MHEGEPIIRLKVLLIEVNHHKAATDHRRQPSAGQRVAYETNGEPVGNRLQDAEEGAGRHY
jgi:hypothetical protein